MEESDHVRRPSTGQHVEAACVRLQTLTLENTFLLALSLMLQPGLVAFSFLCCARVMAAGSLSPVVSGRQAQACW